MLDGAMRLQSTNRTEALPAVPRPNVLYLISDDMRASWGTYGQPVHTPNIDALAERGLLFSRSYCQISVCAPSRMSFMHSRRPGSFDVYNFIDTAPTETISVPRHFRDAGYLTLGLGKGFHQGADGKPVGGCWNANNTWSDEPGYPCFPFELTPCPHGGPGGGHCVLNDEQIYDFHLAKATASYLRFAAEQRRRHGTPFFVLAGFKKPHAPWSAPQRHYDQYNPSAIALPKHPTLPRGAPLVAWSRQLDVRLANGTSFRYDAHTPVPSWVMQDQRRAYYASVSYVDELIGQLLEVVRSEGVQGETIIALHADHGYHLGEHGEWEKKSNFDLVVRVPLLLCVPWLPASHGRRTAALTELIDVGPTLARLSGLPALPGADGTDMSLLLSQPAARPKLHAFHQYPACADASHPPGWGKERLECNNVAASDFWAMGYSVRSDSWRYTRWLRWNGSRLAPEDWNSEDYVHELYDHRGDDSTDMDAWENVNLAEAQPHIAAELWDVAMAAFRRG